MTKLKIEDHVDRVGHIDIGDIEIVVDDTRPGKVELYILDAHGHRMEGGEFDRIKFIDHVLDFYNQCY